jgi:hypothetical protein
MEPSPAALYVRTVAQVEPHIPTDNESGKLANAEIPVGETAIATLTRPYQVPTKTG